MLHAGQVMAARTDQELLADYAATGDEAPFAALVARYNALVYRTCRRVLGNHHDAEEAAQAAFLVLARKAGSLRQAGRVNGWLHRTARLAALEARRRRAAHEARQPEAALWHEGLMADLPAADGGAVLERLDAELDTLSTQHREALVLRYLRGLSEKESAAQAGCPVGTMKSRTSKGLDKLRARLARCGVTTSPTTLVEALTAEASAAVPATLLPAILATVKAAAASGAATALVSTNVMLLAKGALKMLFWTQVKTWAAVAAAVAVLGAAVPLGIALARAGDAAPQPVAAAPAAAPAPAAAGDTIVVLRGHSAAQAFAELSRQGGPRVLQLFPGTLIVPAEMRFRPVPGKELIQRLATDGGAEVQWLKDGQIAVLFRRVADADLARLQTDLNAPAADRRRGAAWRARWFPDPRIVPLLVPVARDPDPDVAQEALRSLAYLGWHAASLLDAAAAEVYRAKVLPPYLENLTDRNASVRLNALWTLAGPDLPDLPDLPADETAALVTRFEAALGDPDYRVRYAANNGLARLAPDRLLDLCEAALADPNSERHGWASLGLYDLSFRTNLTGVRGPRVRALIEKALTSPNPEARSQAALGLALVDREDALNRLAKVLDDPNPAGQGMAVFVLGRLGGDQAVARLEKELKDPNPERQQNALYALGSAGGDRALQRLAEVLDDGDWADLQDKTVRRKISATLFAIGTIGGDKAVAVVERLLAQPNPNLCMRAYSALGYAGCGKAQALIEKALADPDDRIRAAAADVLEYLEPARAEPLLDRALDDPNGRVRLGAIRALRGPQTPARLLGLLRDPDESVRAEASSVLGRPLAEGRLPKLGPLTLDGNLSEWDGAVTVRLRSRAHVAHRLDQHEWRGPADCSLELRGAWNDEGLCLAGVVADDDVRNETAPATSYEQDCVEFYLDGRVGLKFMTPSVGKGVYQLFVRPALAGKAPELAHNQDYGPAPDARVGGKAVPGGWTFELVIPWTAFPEFTPQVGRALGLQFGVDDYDARDGNDAQPLLLTWMGATNLFQSPHKYICWRLAETQTEGEDVNLNLATEIELPDTADPAGPVAVKIELAPPVAGRATGGTWRVRTRRDTLVATGRFTLAPLTPPWQESRGVAFAWTPGDVPDGLYFLEATFTDAAGKTLGQAQRGFVLARPEDRQALRLPGLRATLKLAKPGLAALAFAAKQQQVLTAGAGGVQRYDAQTGKLLATLTDQECAAVCVTPTLIAFAQGNDIRLADANDGAARGELKGHTKSVRALAATADGPRLASAALDNTLRLWDVAQQKQLRELKLDATPRCVALAPDGQLVAVGTVAGNIHLFAVATGKPVAVLTGHTYSVRTLAFAPDGRHLLSGSDDLKAVLWAVPSGQRLRTLTGHSSLVTGVAFTADGKQAVTGAQDGSVRLWNVATGKALRRLVDGQPGFAALALGGATVIVGGQGADVLLLDLKP